MLKSFLEGLDGLTLECEARRGQACSLKDLEALRVEFLGRKGKLAASMVALAQMGPEDKPAAGKKANEVKNALTALLESRQAELEAEAA
jgi:phenylalanyl-tRNA synthetase alpha chain